MSIIEPKIDVLLDKTENDRFCAQLHRSVRKTSMR